jgi:hypothetical protein
MRKEQEEWMAEQLAGIAWTHNVDSALDQARKEQRHVLIDFSAAPM